MKQEFYEAYIKDVPDFPKPGIIFKDITPALENSECFVPLIDDMADRLKDIAFDKIICADARGFLFGSALAYKMNKGLVITRKPGKLSRPGVHASYKLEYGTAELYISEGSILPGEKLILVDDLVATGGSAIAMGEIVEECKASVQASIFFIALDFLEGNKKLQERFNAPVISLVHY